MNLVKRPEYIVVKAQSQSNQFHCDYALIHISENFKKEIEAHVSLCKELANKGDNHLKFFQLSFEDDVICWFASDRLKLPEGMNWSYIEITQEEIDALEGPEDTPETGRIIFDKNGFYYSAYENEIYEYFTRRIDPAQL